MTTWNLSTQRPLIGAVAAEWTKLWTVRSTRWLVCGSVLLMAAPAPSAGLTLANNNEADGLHTLYKPGDVAGGTAFYMVQLMVAALAMLMMTAEYGTGSIRSTLQWVPDRGRLLLAKSVVIGAVTLVMGFVIAVVGVLPADLPLGRYSDVQPGRMACQVAAIAVYICLSSVFTVYLATLIRSAPATLTTAFLVMAVPAVMQASGIPPLVWTSQYTPAIGGRNFIMIDTGPYPAPVGSAVQLAWVVGGFFAARLVLDRRDA